MYHHSSVCNLHFWYMYCPNQFGTIISFIFFGKHDLYILLKFIPPVLKPLPTSSILWADKKKRRRAKCLTELKSNKLNSISPKENFEVWVQTSDLIRLPLFHMKFFSKIFSPYYIYIYIQYIFVVSYVCFVRVVCFPLLLYRLYIYLSSSEISFWFYLNNLILYQTKV